MTNRKFLATLKQSQNFIRYIDYLGEHGHGHYHTASVPY